MQVFWKRRWLLFPLLRLRIGLFVLVSENREQQKSASRQFTSRWLLQSHLTCDPWLSPVPLKTKARCRWVFSQCERSLTQCLFPPQSQVSSHYQPLFLLLSLSFFLSFGFRPESIHPCSLPYLVSKLSEGCWVSAIAAASLVFLHQTWYFLEFSTPCFASRSPSGHPSVSWLPLRSPDVVTCRPSCFSFPQPRCKYIETGVRPCFARLSIAAKLLKPSSAVTCAWLLPSLHQSLWMFEFTARLLATRVTMK